MQQGQGDEGWLGAWFDDHPLAHVIYDPVTQLQLAVNRAACERYGYSRDELMGFTRRHLLVVPDQGPQLDVLLATLRAGAQPAVHPVWLERSKSGRILQSDVRSQPVQFRGQAARLAVIMDAAPRVRLQDEVAEQRELWRVAAAMARVGGWSWQPADGSLVWSDEVCAIFGRPPGSPPSLDDALAHHPPAAAVELRERLERCAAAGEPFDFELPFVAADGRAGWVRCAGVAVRGADGDGDAVQRVHGVMQDTSERKQGELALTDSRERLAATLRALPDLWFVLDPEGRYAEVGDEHHPLLAAPWNTLRGERFQDVMPHPLRETFTAARAAAHASARPQSYRYAMRLRDGRLREFEGRCAALPDGRTLLIARDVTDVVQLEQRFQALAEAVPVGIFETDAAGATTWTNAHLGALFGLPPGSERDLQLRWLEMLHPEDRAQAAAYWRELVDNGRGGLNEYRVVLRDGSERHVAAHSRPMFDTLGEVTGWVGAVVDLSERDRLDAALRQREIAEASRQRQSEFLSRMSHELRTPLNAILGFAQLLEALPETSVQTRRIYAGHVVESGRHMLALVEELLALPAIERGALPLDLQPVQALAAAVAVRDLLEPLAGRHGVALRVDGESSAMVLADARRLRQVLLNLGSNAIRYNRQGGNTRFDVRGAAGRVRFAVEDEGPGIEPEQLARLFVPFERLGRSDAEGTGLGLAITRQLVEAMGGEMHLDSVPGRGTRAWFELPVGG